MDPVTIENALEKKCKNRAWLFWMFLVTASPVSFNSMHLASYAFLGGNPSFFCNIPELVEANWTKDQIREISNPGLEEQSCVHYAWNYSLLKDLRFDKAFDYFNVTTKPGVVKCKCYIYDEETVHQTIASEWDLVCDDLPLRSTAQSTVAIGKLVGAVIFGLISDRFGRKKTFIFASVLYMLTGTPAAFVNSYTVYVILRLLIGFAGSGVYDTGYAILLEITVKDYRAIVGNMFNLGFSFGFVYLAVAAYLTNTWRQLQLAISVPMFLLLINCWFIPESPRWLITAGKLDQVSHVIGSVERLDFNERKRFSRLESNDRPDSFIKNLGYLFKDYFKLFSTPELAKRILICYYLWFVGNLCYYLMALSGSNFDVNPYLYMGISGLIEIPSYFLTVLLLPYLGRKRSGIVFWTFFIVVMFMLPVLPKGLPLMVTALLGRLAGAAAAGLFIFHTLELFPTECRNGAMGSSFTMAQLGPLLAPYMVDILGKKAWWIPTALCGCFAVLGVFLLMLVPETKDTPLLDTISEMKKLEKTRLYDNPEQTN